MLEKCKIGYTYDDVLLIPKYSEIKSRHTVDLTTKLFLKPYEIKIKNPIIPANMDTITELEMMKFMCEIDGTAILHRYLDNKKILEILKDFINKCNIRPLHFGFSVGIKNYKKICEIITENIYKENIIMPYVVIDIAHGDSKHMIETIKTINKNFSHFPIMAGNVATSDGYKRLIEAGANCIKVGVGPGSVCTTRINTGAGFPQLTAIDECASCDIDIPIVADGGIKYSGDITKALAIGANAVMVGSLIAGTDETPGRIISLANKKYKEYRGMSSFEAQIDNGNNKEKIIKEGIHYTISYKGPMKKIMNELLGGIKSGFSYCNAKNIEELQNNAEFILMTNNGMNESMPHIEKQYFQ